MIKPRSFYKPFDYPWAYDLWKKHEAMHWLPSEVEFRGDISDWNSKLTPEEKSLLTQLFRFFTQADIDVASGYAGIYLPKFSGNPELTMMMLSFGAREAVHIDAYSTLIETVGMPESTYKAFQEFSEMKEKHDFLDDFKGDTQEDLLRSLAVYSGFTEGMQLFSSFAILMNFERFNKMKGMCNIVRWSLKDEGVHVEGMTRLFRELLKEAEKTPGGSLGVSNIEEDVSKIAFKMVELEDKFIDLCFKEGGIEGLTASEVKSYIRFIANKRWHQLGFKGYLYELNKENPLKWLDWVINGVEHTSFFEARPTDYSKASLTGSTKDIVW